MADSKKAARVKNVIAEVNSQNVCSACPHAGRPVSGNELQHVSSLRGAFLDTPS